MSTALVTGATAGIGLSFAHQLAERGHDVVLVARNRARLENVSDDLRAKYRVSTEILVADLSDRAETGKVAERLADRARPVDLLVNNAGYSLKRRFLDNDIEDEEALFDVLGRAVLVLSHAAANAMRERGHGAIVNVSSVAGQIASGPYSAVKSFVTVFTEGLATELAGTGVTATALLPGFTHTEFHERAGVTMTSIPEFMWLDADKLVRDCLDDVAKGRVVSVPGAQYKAIVGALRVLPRGLVRSRARRAHRPKD
ncbi:SDR family oxidoreductase [Phycicoccus sp. 3266]|jgi:short-subunit dehydrogenase|uniref:SDR family NAD(P)-dependent oxidoreductase n=1 Tax=Phycicoccus sp. 3266 TaxID=2817751 RepID=UPI00285EA02E|nr:SDR family oxidoreductase [Phycicoccus sp. 3266]MDR6863039.1 short-subunit dehydrogenase [Phycicoccus sp. 3266]